MMTALRIMLSTAKPMASTVGKTSSHMSERTGARPRRKDTLALTNALWSERYPTQREPVGVARRRSCRAGRRMRPVVQLPVLKGCAVKPLLTPQAARTLSEILGRGQPLSSTDGELIVKPTASWRDLMASGVRWAHLQAVGLTLTEVAAAGATARELCACGCDSAAFALCPGLAQQALEAFGRAQVLHEFVRTPTDAVQLAASDAQRALGMSTELLLQRCGGRPTEAEAVLAQLVYRYANECQANAAFGGRIPPTHPLFGVAARTLLKAGIDAAVIESVCGVPAEAVAAVTGIPLNELHLIGYSVRLE